VEARSQSCLDSPPSIASGGKPFPIAHRDGLTVQVVVAGAASACIRQEKMAAIDRLELS
jgi:hypothetical protein